MTIVASIIRREFAAYFATPLAVIFLVVFLGAAGALTFEIGGFLARGHADLSVFFSFHPWLYVVLMPAIGMRIWADERRSGTIEFLMTLPVATWQLVLGKFIAAWGFATLALALTFPVWLTVNYLGSPDNGVILASYAGSLLMGGALLSLACCISAVTSNQVTAFVLAVTAGLLMLLSGLDPVGAMLDGWAPAVLVDVVSSLSFARHFDPITRGVLDLRDVIYFVSFIALMLVLNVLILDGGKRSGPMSLAAGRGPRPGRLAALAGLLGVVLFLSVNTLAGVVATGLRVDLTERRLYTLSESTAALLAAIAEPITLRVYRTPQLLASVPALQAHERAVSELLASFTVLSKGRIRIETIDVLPFSPEEDEALGYELEGLSLGSGGERGYFGIVGTNAVDGLESIPLLTPARDALLQYDLTRLVFRLTQLEEPVVGVVDGAGMFGSMAEGRTPWALLNLVSANFDVRRITDDTTAIPADIDVLLVVHPVRPPQELQQAIDQYVLAGGAALVFIDPLAENSAPSANNPAMPQEPTSQLPELLSAWGVNVDPGKVVGDARMAIQTVGMAGPNRVVANYLPWLRVDRSALNENDVVTAQLEIMRMSSAGSIRTQEDATATVTPLIRSTTESMLLDQAVVVRRVDPNVLLDAFVTTGDRQTLAARISGPVRTAFPEAAGPGRLTDGDVNIIVVADTDMLADSHVVGDGGRLNSSNADFVLNAIETLAGGEALAGVRSSGLSYRPFTAIEAMEARAEQTYRATERRLATELEEIEAQLQALQQTADAPSDNPLETARQQQQAVAAKNARLIELRQQLREVRGALRSEIVALENWLRFANILLLPLSLVLAASVIGLLRRLRFSRSLRRQPAAG